MRRRVGDRLQARRAVLRVAIDVDRWGARPSTLEILMSIGTILLIVLVLMLVGVVPLWPHSRSWGYGPSGGIGLIVIVLVVLLLMGRL
jgi:hypothetical protein